MADGGRLGRSWCGGGVAGVGTEEQEPEPEHSQSWLQNPLLCPVRDRGRFTSVVTNLFRLPNCQVIFSKLTVDI